MNKTKKLGILLASTGVVVVIILLIIGFFKPKGAGILIQSEPAATVYINGEQVGRTPYSTIHEPSEVVIKLVPESFDNPLSPYETKIKLVSGVETIITRDFAQSEADSGGAIVSFEEGAKGESSLAVLSEPDSAQLKLNGLIRGTTPYKTNDIAPGKYSLTLSAPGYISKTIDIQVFDSHMLTAVVKLMASPKMPVEEIKEKEEVKTVKVEILSTPTNFLRVRKEASTVSDEVAKVTPGKQYKFIEEDADWFHIEYEDGKTGWVSSTYAKKVEVSEESTVESSPTPTP